MEIRLIELSGFSSALEALRLPHGYDPRSNTKSNLDVWKDDKRDFFLLTEKKRIVIDPKDIDLMSRLVKAGTEHAKVTRGILAYMEITAPIYWWCEMETYTVGHQRLCSASTMHIDCKGLTGEELQKAKAEIPMGKELKKVDFFSYQCLRNIYKQRKNHRLKEWHEFCAFIEEKLPFSDELITIGLNGKEGE